MLTAERLRELLSYDPETGIFTWRVSKGRKKEGSIAGGIGNHGYVEIGVDNTLRLGHRLAWLYVNGEWPQDEIDHRDGNRTNNAISNLREATSRQNKANASRKSTNTSGYKGVGWHKQRQKWRARIKLSYREKHIGLFHTPEAAHAAYLAAAERYFGEYARAA